MVPCSQKIYVRTLQMRRKINIMENDIICAVKQDIEELTEKINELNDKINRLINLRS